MSNSVYVPGGAGGLQGLRTGKTSDDYYCPLETKGSQDGGDWAMTRMSGGLGHAQTSSLSSAPPSSYYRNASKPQDG
jgi:hypothetical protein